jgi:hypothetical protein
MNESLLAKTIPCLRIAPFLRRHCGEVKLRRRAETKITSTG